MGTGYQKYIDVATAKKYHIPVSYTPSANAKAVAEYTVALILDVVKKITHSNNEVKNKEWNIRYCRNGSYRHTHCKNIMRWFWNEINL